MAAPCFVYDMPVESNLIYLDNAATTCLCEEALAAMQPCFTGIYANPSSLHGAARAARQLVEKARREIASLIGADTGEVYFTSGGTEGDVTVLRSAAHAGDTALCPLIAASAVEHHAVLETLSRMEREGICRTALIAPNADGVITEESVRRFLIEHPGTTLVSVMACNNETGAVMPIRAISTVCHEHGALVHTDAVQMMGHMPVDVHALGVDYLTASAHKFHGPKGCGLLYVRKGAPFLPLLTGGKQELEHRAGTENVPGIVGMQAALKLACDSMERDAARMTELRTRLEEGILENVSGSTLHAERAARHPGIASFRFSGIEAEQLLILLDMNGICASGGSACTAGSLEPSHVLLAMGVAPAEARGAVRFSLSRYTTEEEIDCAIKAVIRSVSALRGNR